MRVPGAVSSVTRWASASTATTVPKMPAPVMTSTPGARVLRICACCCCIFLPLRKERKSITASRAKAMSMSRLPPPPWACWAITGRVAAVATGMGDS